jgi:hypothetical protein
MQKTPITKTQQSEAWYESIIKKMADILGNAINGAHRKSLKSFLFFQ